MATTNTDAFNLKSVDLDGIIHEDVMDEIFNIDPVDLPYMDMADRQSSDNQYRSWVKENLSPIDLENALVDGQDAPDPGVFDEARIGNHHQIMGKRVQVSKRARTVDTIGYADRLIHELMLRQKELKRDMEATLLSNQGSVEGTDTVAGKFAGCPAMFETNIFNGAAGGFAGGIFSPPVPGAAIGLTEDMLRDAAEAAYNEGGDVSVLMSTPRMIRTISEYLFKDEARVATLTTERNSAKKGEYGHQGVTAIGSVNTFVSDFDTLTFTPNRTMQPFDNGGTTCAHIFLFDPQYWAVSYLYGVEVEELGKTGLSDGRMMSVDFTNMALQEKASAIIMGVDPSVAMTAGV